MCVCVSVCGVGWGDRVQSSGKEAVPQSVGSCFYGPIPSSKRQTVYYLGGWSLQQCSWPSFGHGQHTLSPCLWEDFPQSPVLFSLPKPSAFCLVSCSCHTILTYWDRGCFLLWFCRSLQQAQGEPIPFMAPEEKQPLLDLLYQVTCIQAVMWMPTNIRLFIYSTSSPCTRRGACYVLLTPCSHPTMSLLVMLVFRTRLFGHPLRNEPHHHLIWDPVQWCCLQNSQSYL